MKTARIGMGECPAQTLFRGLLILVILLVLKQNL